MSYCINPNCPKPQNTANPLFCQACGSDLLLDGCYRVTRMLTNPNKPSGFGTIYEVDDRGRSKILKVLHNTHPKAIELFVQEAEALKRLNHPGIPSVDSDGYFTFLPRNSTETLHCLVMEKIEGMNLEEFLSQRNYQPISERAAVRWLKQVVEILHQVHQQQYFHRDIKPSNIMLRPDGQLTLIDFGTAREVTQTYMNKVAEQQVTGIISVGYTPPEQMKGKAVPQSDFFTLGRTFVFLLTGKYPNYFAEDSLSGELIWRDSASGVSQRLANLINYLMAPFPGNRPKDTQEILDLLAVIEPSARATQEPVQNVQPTVSGGNIQQVAAVSGVGGQIESSLAWEILLRRLVAYFIDIFISCVVIIILGVVGNAIYIANNYNTTSGSYVLMIVGFIIFVLLYFILSESSAKQATFGKRILKLVVTDTKGNRISFWRATGRFVLMFIFISLNFYIIGVIIDSIPYFLKKKRSLQQIMTGTVVKKRSV